MLSSVYEEIEDIFFSLIGSLKLDIERDLKLRVFKLKC